MTVEGATSQGPNAIIEKLSSLPIGNMERAIDTVDVQISGQNTLLIFVTGRLSVDNEQPQRYSHCFLLNVTGPTTYSIQNEVFRLLYG